MKFFRNIIALFSTVLLLANAGDNQLCTLPITPANNCVNFSVGSGTGCAWMCNYCASSLGTNNYYFTDNVCTYQEGTGCVGNPVSGQVYTCCSV